jgi:hypothetical protein
MNDIIERDKDHPLFQVFEADANEKRLKALLF